MYVLEFCGTLLVCKIGVNGRTNGNTTHLLSAIDLPEDFFHLKCIVLVVFSIKKHIESIENTKSVS